MSLLEELKDLGTDVSQGMERVMGDSSLYEMMLGMFVSSVQENHVTLEDFDGGDLEDVIRRVHTLKGVTGNLAITPLFNGYTEILGLLRSGDAQTAKKQFEQVLTIQGKVLDCINRYA